MTKKKKLTVYIDFLVHNSGITQEEIDDRRLETERYMLEDLKKIAAAGGNLEFRDKNRATPVSYSGLKTAMLVSHE